jgi:HEPN domain-containing protein
MKGDPHNPADWCQLARTDLARASRDLAAGDTPACAFWLAQAVEKALKGWLIGQGWQLVKTHDLKRLAAEVHIRGIDLSAHDPHLQRLSRLYFTDRYVDDSGEPEADAAEAAALLATVEIVLKLLFPPAP